MRGSVAEGSRSAWLSVAGVSERVGERVSELSVGGVDSLGRVRGSVAEGSRSAGLSVVGVGECVSKWSASGANPLGRAGIGEVQELDGDDEVSDNLSDRLDALPHDFRDVSFFMSAMSSLTLFPSPICAATALFLRMRIALALS